jgi:hypothetical protein
MRDAARFAFTPVTTPLGVTGFSPLLPITLTYQNQSVTEVALLDTGAAINVLPFEVGLALGAVWKDEKAILQLTGNLAQYEACPLVVQAIIAPFPPVQLAFAWTKASHIRMLLGRVNFFAEFDVCFYGSQQCFEICPKA